MTVGRLELGESDDIRISKGSHYVDNRRTTLHHIGELMASVAAGVVDEADAKGELHDLIGMEHSARTTDDENSVFNKGCAHPDLKIADCVTQAVGGKA